jgi:NADPH:quinone reductase-like Zn-dependent oxidoreductase
LENGAFSESVAREEEHLCLIPDNLCEAPAAGLTVTYNALIEERQLLLFSDEFV